MPYQKQDDQVEATTTHNKLHYGTSLNSSFPSLFVNTFFICSGKKLNILMKRPFKDCFHVVLEPIYMSFTIKIGPVFVCGGSAVTHPLTDRLPGEHRRSRMAYDHKSCTG